MGWDKGVVSSTMGPCGTAAQGKGALLQQCISATHQATREAKRCHE